LGRGNPGMTDTVLPETAKRLKTDLILSNINRHINLDQHEIQGFTSLLKERDLAKHESLLTANESCATINYVVAGALRAFYKDENEKEATIMFATKDWWITDMPSFVSGGPAMINIEAITKSSVLQLSRRDMDELLDNHPKFERYFRILMQNAYVREQLRVLQRLSMPAEVRYANFVKKYPEILQQVPLKNIASYLGITPEFLSAIRAKSRKR
jgi:CRP-like cAMP-binding protein